MKLTHNERKQIGKEVQRQLAWASVIVGAPRYSFIEISRGYWIKGLRGSTNRSGGASAWSRAPEGAMSLHWPCSSGRATVLMDVEPGPGMMSRQIECKHAMAPTSWPRGEKIKTLASWLVCEAVARLPEWDDIRMDNVRLLPGEKLQIVQYRVDAPTWHGPALRERKAVVA